MISEGEFEKKISLKIFKARLDSKSRELLVIENENLKEVLRLAKADFPKKEATLVIGSDGEEHFYETYDTEAIERWFAQWFGK
jgi:hypothetical protein